MRLTYEQKLPVILLFVFIVLALLGVVFYQSTVSFQEALFLEKRSQNIVLGLEKVLTTTLDAESDMRGFVFTGNTTYAENYDRGKKAVAQNVTELKAKIAESGHDTALMERLSSQVSEFWQIADAKIERRKMFGPDQAIEEMRVYDTKAVLDKIRASSDQLKTNEQTVLKARNQELESGLFWTIRILIIATVLGIMSLVIANALIWREGRKRNAAEVALLDANKGLESKVKKRTEELEIANESLQLIAAERELLFTKEQKAREEAEIANRLRDEFMATVSHELKTPLNSILGWARMMKSGSLDEPTAGKALATIIKNSETQNRLIEDLLDIARIISGKLQLDNGRVDVMDVLRHSIESVRPAANSKSIKLELEAEDLPESVFMDGDRDRLIQIFTNLLTNALRFSPDNNLVKVNATLTENNIKVVVIDNGIGISSGFLPLVFERFRQDVSSGRDSGGLGLGLAIVRNLVELHGGEVSAHSEGKEKGAEFTVVLPVEINGSQTLGA